MKNWVDMISTDLLVVRNSWWLLWLIKASLYVAMAKKKLKKSSFCSDVVADETFFTRPGVFSHGLLFLQLLQVTLRQ